MRTLLSVIIFTTFFTTISAQTVNVVLKNSKIVAGEVVEENPLFLLIQNDTGELKILRNNIESVTYKSSENIRAIKNQPNKNIRNNDKSIFEYENVVLNDIVVIYLRNEDIVSGKLMAKSLDMILLQTEAGSLTIPKREIQIIEYVSSEYAERGEVVIAYLANGTQFEGNIYFEDFQSLILDTKVGRLTIDKKNLRSIEYTGEQGTGNETLATQFATVAKEQPLVPKRLDVVSLGYSPTFGPDYGTGFALGYSSKFLLSHMEGFYLSAVGGLNLNYFTLNKDNFTDELPSVSASGTTFLTTISGGAAITLYQGASSSYEFYISPQLEANIIYKNLTKEYPSYPAFDSKTTTTEFVFGIGNKIGIDILMDNMKVGISYDLHFLFGDEDYNTITLNYTASLF